MWLSGDTLVEPTHFLSVVSRGRAVQGLYMSSIPEPRSALLLFGQICVGKTNLLRLSCPLLYCPNPAATPQLWKCCGNENNSIVCSLLDILNRSKFEPICRFTVHSAPPLGQIRHFFSSKSVTSFSRSEPCFSKLISVDKVLKKRLDVLVSIQVPSYFRSEEHTSELQSQR